MSKKKFPTYTNFDGGAYTETEKKEETQKLPDVEIRETVPTEPAGTTASGNGWQSEQSQQIPATAAPDPEAPQYQYDPGENDGYQKAMAALTSAQAGMPTYAGTYDAQLLELYNKITNREGFSYNINEDALFQQYKDQYTTQGKIAMMDAMGQAAALTGGYGSSYGQAVGQQAYQGYLQRLNEVVPELYGMALDQYNQEGQNLLNQYSLLSGLRDDEYGRYQDSLDQYWRGVDYHTGRADAEYDRGYNEWLTGVQLSREDEDINYSRQQDNYSKLANLITATGYQPTAEELTSAGMSESQAKALLGTYKESSGSGHSNSDSSDGGTWRNFSLQELEGIQNTAKFYAQFGEDAVRGYLNNAVEGEGLDPDVASGIYSQLFPEEQEEPEEPRRNGNFRERNGAGR